MKEIEKIIKKHYLPSTRNYKKSKRGWEACGNEVYNLICKREDEIKSKNLLYSLECKKCEIMRKKIESEYESYFAFRNINGIIAGYDWIHGNNKLKQLLSK